MGPLRGRTILVIGGSAAVAEPLRAPLADAGAELRHLADPAELVAGGGEVAVVAQDGALAELAERLDPLGLGGGPLVLAASELEPNPARRLALLLERRDLQVRVDELEAVVAGQALAARRAVEAAERDALRRLAIAADYADDNTREHTERVAHLAALVGRRLGLPTATVELVRLAAPLHDVGKIAVPGSILLKPDRLDPEEFEVVRTHAAVGARILSGGTSELLAVAARIARSHHERWDGTGYPDGLAQEEIPLEGRLVAVADVFDVLVHERPYRERWTVPDAAAEILAAAGTQLDPRVVEAFAALGERAWTSSPGPLPSSGSP